MTITTMIIGSKDGPISDADTANIYHLIEVSRVILRSNHNRSWNAPIALVTDNIKLAHVRLANPKWHINPDGTKKTYYGFCWNTDKGHVLWFRNHWTRNRYETVRTLCHEVAHALVATSVHGQTWRRAYALLLPFWIQVLDPPKVDVPLKSEIYDEMVRIALKYRRRSNRSLFAIGDEVSDHVAASTEMWSKKKGLFIPTTV
jgi:hypothetical protein